MRRLFSMVMIGTVAATLAACGGSSSSSSGGSTPAANGTSNPAAAKAAVTALYGKFFNAPEAQATALLQDGSSLGAAIKAAARVKGSAEERAIVKSVTFTDANDAAVVYALQSKAKSATKWTTVLPSASGAAVLVNGQWLFSKTTFCTLVGLADPKVPGCSS